MHEGDWWDEKDDLESQIIDEANDLFDFLDEFTAVYADNEIPKDPASDILKLHEFSLKIHDKILKWKKI